MRDKYIIQDEIKTIGADLQESMTALQNAKAALKRESEKFLSNTGAKQFQIVHNLMLSVQFESQTVDELTLLLTRAQKELNELEKAQKNKLFVECKIEAMAKFAAYDFRIINHTSESFQLKFKFEGLVYSLLVMAFYQNGHDGLNIQFNVFKSGKAISKYENEIFFLNEFAYCLNYFCKVEGQ